MTAKQSTFFTPQKYFVMKKKLTVSLKGKQIVKQTDS